MMCLFGDDSEQDHINDENDDCNDGIGDGVCDDNDNGWGEEVHSSLLKFPKCLNVSLFTGNTFQTESSQGDG